MFMKSIGSLLTKGRISKVSFPGLPFKKAELPPQEKDSDKSSNQEHDKIKPALEPPIKPENAIDTLEEKDDPEEKPRAQSMGVMEKSQKYENEFKVEVIEEEDDLDRPETLEHAINNGIPAMILPSKVAKDKDLFKAYFCRHFDTILKINKNDALNIEKQIFDPLVLELKDYINLEALQQHWANGKPYTMKEKILLKMLTLWRWIKRVTYFIVVDVLVSFFRNFFTNQFVIIFLETVLAIIYVVYSEPSYILYPIILWIFLNVYPKFDSIIALNMKIWLLMVPTGINSLIAKQQVSPELANSTNNDFNFNYKGDHQFFDISTLGVVLMSFVILEMIIMASKKSRDEYKKNDIGPVKSSLDRIRASVVFFTIVNVLYNNSIYLIMINIYLIALDINIISLGLIVYFIRLILGRHIGDKTYYTLFWYNQVSIAMRYFYNHMKLNSEEKASPHTNLYKLIGVEESDNMSAKTKLLLNFSLQLLLIVLIFCKRNQDSLGMMQGQEIDQISTRRAFASISGIKRIFNNLLELFRYSAFHCIPWVTYLIVYLAMILTSTSLITMTELFYLSYVFVSHARHSIEQRFGGLQNTGASWKGMITYSAVMALGRYCLWFITQPYLQDNFAIIKNTYTFISQKLGFIGLLPARLAEAYLELLPSFLCMYLGSLVLHRITMIEYTLKHEADIMEIDLEEPDYVLTIDVLRVDTSKAEDDLSPDRIPHNDSLGRKESKRYSVFPVRKPAIQPGDELKVKLTEKDKIDKEERDINLKARKEVIGDISALRYALVYS